MTTPTPPQPLRCDRPDCRCGAGETVPIDPERLRKLRAGLERNTMALSRIIDQILAELDDERRAA